MIALLVCIAQSPTKAASSTDDVPQPAPKPTELEDGSHSQPAPPGLGLARWINPSTPPFIPVPVISADPNSGTTLGILPTWIHTNDKDEISRSIAPDLIHNPDFGWGADARIFNCPSDNEQWSLVAALSERTQRGFDGEYQRDLRPGWRGTLLRPRQRQPPEQ